MKSTNTYQEGYLGLTSGYLWSGILYNASVTLSLYSLAMFWVCMSQDLKPFRPVPKFLCIKLIIFASYWQGFFLSILQFAGAIPNDVQGYTADNLAAAIQDALICIEMPFFAISHWYAFSWKDYADVTISAARMPVKFAIRDAFGCRDLIEDTRETFAGKNYEYRVFDSGDNVLTHEESSSRAARMSQGMRYGRDGKGKYWIPTPGEVNSRTPLLGGSLDHGQSANFVDRKQGSMTNGVASKRCRTLSSTLKTSACIQVPAPLSLATGIILSSPLTFQLPIVGLALTQTSSLPLRTVTYFSLLAATKPAVSLSYKSSSTKANIVILPLQLPTALLFWKAYFARTRIPVVDQANLEEVSSWI